MAIKLSKKTDLDWPDYVFILLVLILCMAIGIFFKRQSKNRLKKNKNGGLLEYLFASRSLSVIPAGLSISTSVMSAYFLTGISGEFYYYGAQMAIGYFATLVGILVISNVIIPLYRKRQFVSIFQVLEDRFDGCVRRIFSFLYIFEKIFYLCLVLYLPALSLSTLTPYDHRLTALVLGLVCTAYSSLGGFRTVIWTDVIQCLLVIITTLMVIFQGAIRVGSLGDIWPQSVENGFLTAFYWSEGGAIRYSIWAVIASQFIVSLDSFLINQTVLQRIIGAKSDSVAKSSFILGGIVFCLMGLMICLAGAVLYIVYGQCDPLSLPEYTGVEKLDQLFVYAIGDLFNDFVILRGLAISGIISASLSTFSSFINGFATLALEDFVIPLFPRLTENQNTSVAVCMIISFLFGTVATLGSLLIPLLGNAVEVLAIITGIFRGPSTGVMILVLFYKKLTKQACLFAVSLGMIINSWIILGNLFHVEKRIYDSLVHSTDFCDIDGVMIIDMMNNTLISKDVGNTTVFEDNLMVNEGIFMPFYKISFLWYNVIGVFISFVAGIVFSEISYTCEDRGNSSRRDPATSRYRHPVMPNRMFNEAKDSFDDEEIELNQRLY